MVITAKVKKRNILIALIAIAAVLAVLFWLGDKSSGQESAEIICKAETNDERIAFLQQFGWEVADAAIETQEVRIPTEPNEVFARYNELQKLQNFDLEQYAGKVVKRYVYDILNHPDGENCRATLFVYRGKVIGGDVSSTDLNGKMQGFARHY